MMFLISGDNISHMPFSIWRLPQLLWFYKKKFDPTLAWPIITCPKKNSHDQNHMFKNSHDQNYMPNKIFHVQNFMSNTKIQTHIQIKISWPLNKTYTRQQIFRTHHEFVQPSLYNKFFITTMPPKFKLKFIQQHHILHTLPKFHESSTLSKLHHAKKLNNSKWPQSQDYNMINHVMSKISTKANHNKMTMSQHQTCNKAWNQQISKKKKKKKLLTLKSILECGAWVLGSWRSPSSSFHSRDGWYFFPWKVRKDGLLEDETIVNAKKKEVWKWVSQNGYEAKMAKNTRIWKDIEEDQWRKVEKPRKMIF